MCFNPVLCAPNISPLHLHAHTVVAGCIHTKLTFLAAVFTPNKTGLAVVSTPNKPGSQVPCAPVSPSQQHAHGAFRPFHAHQTNRFRRFHAHQTSVFAGFMHTKQNCFCRSRAHQTPLPHTHTPGALGRTRPAAGGWPQRPPASSQRLPARYPAARSMFCVRGCVRCVRCASARPSVHVRIMVPVHGCG